MKKFALSLMTLAVASSAHAYTAYDNAESGTKLDLDASLRLIWQSSANKTAQYTTNTTTRNHTNHAVSNNGSRFGFKITQQLGHDFYALGRMQFRFRGTAPSQHNFDDIYTHTAFVGVGHKQYGELIYGHIGPHLDSVKQTDLANTLSISGGLLPGTLRNALQYTYKGIENLELAAVYGGHEKRNNNGTRATNTRKHVFGASAIYKWKLDENQKITFGTGFVRDSFNTPAGLSYSRSAYAFDTAYTYDKTTFGLDLEQRVSDPTALNRGKRTENEVRTTAFHRLTPNWNIYTQYAYTTDRTRGTASSANSNIKRHKYMIGTELQTDPRWVKTFVEWQTIRSTHLSQGVKQRKTRDNAVVIGARLYW